MWRCHVSTALCAFWGTYGCMTAIAAEVTYTWKLPNLWCWSRRKKNSCDIWHGYHLVFRTIDRCIECNWPTRRNCTWPKANARHSNRAALPQKPPREGVVPAEVFKPILSCLSLGQRILPMSCCLFGLCSHWNIYQYLSIYRCASTLSETLVDKREFSLATSSTEVKLLEVSKRPAHARASTSQSLACWKPWNTHVCNKQ